jgi:hypothetical protein
MIEKNYLTVIVRLHMVARFVDAEIESVDPNNLKGIESCKHTVYAIYELLLAIHFDSELGERLYLAELHNFDLSHFENDFIKVVVRHNKHYKVIEHIHYQICNQLVLLTSMLKVHNHHSDFKQMCDLVKPNYLSVLGGYFALILFHHEIVRNCVNNSFHDVDGEYRY